MPYISLAYAADTQVVAAGSIEKLPTVLNVFWI
jgi:hypothetical protein